MININYQKRSNNELFKNFENKDNFNLSKIQNYIPIYKKFFSLNKTNYNNINLNNEWFILKINNIDKIKNNNNKIQNKNCYNCNIKNINTQNILSKNIFFKIAPLLDPYKYLVGKYNINDNNLFKLPTIEDNDSLKINDTNNSAYVDGFFSYLSSSLINKYNFHHGVEYYGSFLAIQNNFTINVFDDLEYLNQSNFFNINKDVLFKIDNYDHLFIKETNNLAPIKIDYTSTSKSNLSIKSIDDIESLFEDIFEKDNNSNTGATTFTNELIDITNSNDIINCIKDNNVSLKSNSSCSSRSSYTNSDDSDEELNNDDNNNKSDENSNESDAEESNNDESDGSYESYESDEEEIYVTIPQFPIEIICMEKCDNTFDDLIISNNLKDEEWYSAFMQIIMILITYQKAFSFTHNDLHTNNVMYNDTNKKYIYYCYNKKYYKVPTFGRIFKIIDFGRSIYKFNKKLFCSDSFKNGEDAATQYNTEPYFNEKKPRLEPNYSFDICRLACSIFDYVIDDMSQVKNCNPLQKLIVEWCLDDNGINVLYKNNGVERYPDFKLYKMISRYVHNHTPQLQLNRPEFNKFIINKINLPKDIILMNIDEYES